MLVYMYGWIDVCKLVCCVCMYVCMDELLYVSADLSNI